MTTRFGIIGTGMMGCEHIRNLAQIDAADVVAIADVYAAGEEPIEGVSRDALVGGLRAHGHRSAHALTGPEGLAPFVARHAEAGDLVVCLGAGTISTWVNALPQALEQLEG